VASAAGITLAACGEGTPTEPAGEPPEGSSATEQAPFTAVIAPETSIAGATTRMQVPPDVLAARESMLVTATPADVRRAQTLRELHWSTNFKVASVALSELHTSSLERYGPLPVDSPRYLSVEAARAFLSPQDPVVAFLGGANPRAYPLRFLLWHEVVNDMVGGRPILIAYDPGTNAARVYERRVLGAGLRFRAVDGFDRGSRLLWDSLTQSWWRQFSGEAIVGDFTGLRLQARPSLLVSLAEYSQAFPDGWVLEPRSRPQRDDTSDYGVSNHPGYDGRLDPPAYFGAALDSRLPPTARVLALELNSDAIALPFSRLAEVRVVNDDVGGQPMVALWSPGALSVSDTPKIADARDVGMAAAHGREVAGRLLTFEFAAGVFRDLETGSVWSLGGRALSGPLAGAQLPALVHACPFWFAWAAFHPQTRLVTSPA